MAMGVSEFPVLVAVAARLSVTPALLEWGVACWALGWPLRQRAGRASGVGVGQPHVCRQGASVEQPEVAVRSLVRGETP